MSQSLVSTNQLKALDVWRQLSLYRKVGLGALVVAAITGLIFFFTWAQTPDYATAFTDLTGEDGAAVVDYLKENNIAYELANGGTTIRVPADQVYETRLALAGQGLPGEGAIGMELFDTASLGMTDFVQQVNYQRALEGELARTISSLNAVESARVHIVIPQPVLFSEEEEPTTASVVVDLQSGQRLSPEQVRAISHLVSSAVEGLIPENLTIVDMDGNVLADGRNGTVGMAYSASQIEAQRNYERDLERRIETMLTNILGPDKAVVRVAAEMNWDQVETETETYFPGEEGGVLRSSRVITEAYGADALAAGGIPGTASNIPDAAPSFQTDEEGAGIDDDYLRYDLTSNYEVSRTSQRTIAATGQVEKLSVSVVVDNVTDPTTLNAIEQAAVAAAGVDQARGDVLTVNSIEFDRTLEVEQSAAQEESQQREFYLQLAQWGAVAVALLALFFVVRSMLRSLRPAPVKPEIKVEEPADSRTALLEEMSRMADLPAGELGELPKFGPPSFDPSQQHAAEKVQMMRQLQLMARNKPETIAQIIQFWLAEDSNQP